MTGKVSACHLVGFQQIWVRFSLSSFQRQLASQEFSGRTWWEHYLHPLSTTHVSCSRVWKVCWPCRESAICIYITFPWKEWAMFFPPRAKWKGPLLKTRGTLKRDSLAPHSLVKCFQTFRPPGPLQSQMHWGQERLVDLAPPTWRRKTFDTQFLCFKI